MTTAPSRRKTRSDTDLEMAVASHVLRPPQRTESSASARQQLAEGERGVHDGVEADVDTEQSKPATARETRHGQDNHGAGVPRWRRSNVWNGRARCRSVTRRRRAVRRSHSRARSAVVRPADVLASRATRSQCAPRRRARRGAPEEEDDEHTEGEVGQHGERQIGDEGEYAVSECNC